MLNTLVISPKILREYDIRGIVGQDFDTKESYLIGKGYGTKVKRAGGSSVVVGYDGRLTSPNLEAALVDGLASTGLRVLRVGLGPSPMTYFASFHLESDAAVMVTGSHNPSSYNGFKMTFSKKPFFGEQIKILGHDIAQGDFEEGQGSIENFPIEEAYISYLVNDFISHYKSGKPLKVVWDIGNGATGNIVKSLVPKLPGEHILLNEEIDGTFPAHHPDPVVAENLSQLIRSVKAHQADLGFAFDGDGDRIGVVDAEGHIIWGDQLLILLSEEVLKCYPGSTIIADVKASQVLFNKIAEMGGVPLMWRTGHSLIKTKMAETGCRLAGEMSGHIFFADRHFGFDDALYAALRTLGAISTRKESLSEWYKRLPLSINTPEIRFECANHDKFFVISQVRQALEADQVSFISLDGVRVVNQHGWWLLRASNTTEELVARVEANTLEGLEVLKKELKAYLEKFSISVYNLQ
jgi:phosphomannomutase